ncbi:hypothetical protein A2W54_02165 [Candidatus Giovannonibacteria bacterium RIFCSPHIGHO2_02_43_13]|uniref:Uncharacterized protein n=1 Tax=Candidatus Giovannonibacteria bacterium RIFCSPHIGHO2_02_43_13 TaxID=1798330 RepID=A0A1F5WUF9_9BACT|nr:MAG: hypothetical protein UW28_C0010G0019 [Parcubacteria group bacterium GW2011_GWA2_44_13]OGF73180.1 MAG: hypothetical protein A3E06_04370 [Candidatus Giovannonibacteria bacterium RIFCSPHIGHO2_12_FULL_44_42]OGF79264.1 MAG: hypothetical protein A2W54_02165 [Candidatus Giovannonibacteria bacterium RIFCSPHIGHO2_02_43_13]OGF88724.1 MAG: hypothetical protein A3I94_01430 [Candidatus Giovannonibacteria bacterium RIFCSPLOWO2_02_FULL_43_54]
MTRKTDGNCMVCGGEIVQKTVERFDARHGPMIIGPGGRKQMVKASAGLHCDTCGLKYEFLPKKEAKEALENPRQTLNKLHKHI